MLGWSRPFKTSISLQTAASLPLTFFFGITFKATSFTTETWEIPPGDGGAEELDAREIDLFMCGWRRGMVDRPEGWSIGDAGGVATAPWRDTSTKSGGTCHDALYSPKNRLD